LREHRSLKQFALSLDKLQEQCSRFCQNDLVSGEQGVRAAARVAQIEAIKTTARELLTKNGAAGLSLREVAREMGLVSSALYRYFATRDELLTALIFDAYNDLGSAVEQAAAADATSPAAVRWRSSCHAVRTWALAHPNEFALLYGTPIPGYNAPTGTIAAATRVAAVFGSILNDDRAQKAEVTVGEGYDVRPFLSVSNLALVMPAVDPSDYLRGVMAWTHIFGHLTFELFGHLVGTVTNPDLAYDAVVDELREWLRLGE
jgi:AcrR family transcriptional regulator